MRLIDADALQNILLPITTALEHEYGSLGGAVSGCMKHIDNAPTVDAVPVVRCENCHHGEPGGDEIACLHPELVMETDGCTPIRKKDFFCAFGETKEGADNEP